MVWDFKNKFPIRDLWRQLCGVLLCQFRADLFMVSLKINLSIVLLYIAVYMSLI